MKRVPPDALVNTQVDGLAFGPHVAALPGGGYVVGWGVTGAGNVVRDELQRFDANGQPLGSEVTIASGGGFSGPNITDLVALSSGDFLVAIAGSGAPFLLRYHSDGTQVATVNLSGAFDVSLAASNATGGYAAAWEQGPNGADSVQAQIFDASNNPLTGVIPVSSGHSSNANNPALDWLSNGNLVIVYDNAATEHVNAWIFNPSGTAISGEIDVGPTFHTGGNGPDPSPDVVALANGNFAVVWENNAGAENIHGRIFSANGAALTPDFTINTINTTTFELNRDPDATALPDGTFYVTWEGSTDFNDDILGQVVDGAGHRVGSEIVVNRFQGFTEISPDATLVNGKLLTVFVDASHVLTNSAGQTDPDRGIGSQTLDPNGSEFAHTHSWTSQQHGPQIWSVGDFNGDGMDDILRYDPGVSGAEVFTSDSASFTGGSSWTGAGNDSQGWYVGDFNGDGLSDIFRYNNGVSGAQVLLSNGSSFASPVSWTPAGNDGRWYLGDFNGDGMTDIFRYHEGVSGAEVLLSNGSSFGNPVSWTGAGNDSQGWYVGDFNGDGRDDIFRFNAGVSGAEVFLSTGSSFVSAGSWTGAGNEGFWYVGDYNGDGRADIFRTHAGVSGAEVFLSNGTGFVADGSYLSDSNNGPDGWYRGDFNGDQHTDIFRSLPGTSGADVFLSI